MPPGVLLSCFWVRTLASSQLLADADLDLAADLAGQRDRGIGRHRPHSVQALQVERDLLPEPAISRTMPIGSRALSISSAPATSAGISSAVAARALPYPLPLMSFIKATVLGRRNARHEPESVGLTG
jgi:hypothetical protein